MTELKRLQSVILSIIKDVDALCVENGIEYYLLGGSAIGAIRHKGFIPWDDDLDIIMTADNYNKFVEVCRAKLDKEKYYFQEGLKDWPLYFSKVKLRGTKMVEYEGYANGEDKVGIYVDVFKMDNVSSSKLSQYWQYFCAKYYLCHQLSVRTYNHTSLKKKLMMALALPLRVPLLREFVKHQVEKYNGKDSEYLGFFYGRTRMKSAIVKRSIFGKPVRVMFEDTMLPVAEHYHEYLTQVFGDYMKLPPVDQQKGLHLVSVDFGKY